MNKLLLILMLAMVLILPGCSGCDKAAKKAETQNAEKKAFAPKPVAEPQKEKKLEDFPEPKKEEKPSALADMTEEESKEKVLAIMPDVVQSFNSGDFKEKLQNAAKSKDFKQLTQVMQDVINDACSKNGLSFEDCVKLMKAPPRTPL